MTSIRFNTWNSLVNVSYNGFAYLTLQGPNAVMKYIDVEDTMIFQENWRVENGAVIVEKADAV